MSGRNRNKQSKNKRAKSRAKSQGRGARNSAKSVSFQQAVMKSLGGGYSQTGTKQASKVSNPSNVNLKEAKQAAGVLATQLLNPCTSERLSFPDQYNGKVEFVNCVTTKLITSSRNHKMIIVHPTSVDKFRESPVYPAAWSASFVESADTMYSSIINSGAYKYIRPVSYCVRVTKSSGATTDNGMLRVACAPIDTDGSFSYPATWTAAQTLLDTNNCMLVDPVAGFEISWCPEAQDNFVPFVPTSLSTTGSDIKGTPLNYRPSLLFLWDNITNENSTLCFEATTRYECYLAPTFHSRGVNSSMQNQSAIDIVMSAIPQMCFVKQGSLAYKAADYAAKVGAVIAGQGFGAIASKAVSKISC